MASIETLASDKLEAHAFHRTSPVALDFYQARCPPCRTLEPRLERLAEQYVGRLPVYRVDIERDMAVAKRFRVQSIPTVLLLRECKEVERLDGLITDDDLKAAFERAIRALGPMLSQYRCSSFWRLGGRPRGPLITIFVKCLVKPVFHGAVCLLATLIMIFGFQADNITDKFLLVGLIAIPILIQVYFNASLTYGLMRLFGVRTPWPRQERLSEQAIFGSGSGAVLATVVGQGEWPSRQTSPDPHRKLLQFFP